MELTERMEEFMNDLIGERMEQVYQEKDGQQYDPFNEKLEMKLQKIFQKLSDKQRTILFDYMTETSNKCSDLNEFYYRMGLRDGLMLKEVTSSQPHYNLPSDSQTSPTRLLIQATPIGYLAIFQMLPTFSAHDLP